MRASAVVREGRRNRNHADDRLSPSGRFLVDGWCLALIGVRPEPDDRTGRTEPDGRNRTDSPSSAKVGNRPESPSASAKVGSRTDAGRTDALPGAGENMAKKPRLCVSDRAHTLMVGFLVGQIEKPLRTKGFSHELRLYVIRYETLSVLGYRMIGADFASATGAK